MTQKWLTVVDLVTNFQGMTESDRSLIMDMLTGQNRELEIEAALDKVRARSMAMMKTEELHEVVKVVFDMLKELDVVLDGGVAIITFIEGSKDVIHWIENPDLFSIPVNFTVPYVDYPIFTDRANAFARGLGFFSKTYGFEEKNVFWKYCFEHSDYKKASKAVKKRILESQSFGYFAALEKNSVILTSSFEGRTLTEEKSVLLKRFSGVFEQIYIRFLDLKKLEAQEREAQIEAALEHVRSCSLSMHKSEEMQQVITVVFQKLRELNVALDGACICTFVEGSKDIVFWIAVNEQLYSTAIRVPHINHPVQIDFWKAKEHNEAFLNKTYSIEEKNSIWNYNFLHTDFKYLQQDRKNLILNGKGYAVFVAFEKNCAIGVNNFEGSLLVDSEVKILQRFANVFNQTYTRFLDLQKAEAQAREARIEAALEKIRSRSLTMRQSVEIKEVVAILFEKLTELKLVFDGGAGIHLFTEGSKDAVIWVASPELSEPSCVNLPFDEEAFKNNPIITDVWKAKETGENIYNKFYSFEEKNTYFAYVFKHNNFVNVPANARELLLKADSYTASFIAEKNSLLGANSWTRQLFSEKELEVLKRIARVFEQAYIRFLDLKKSEAQEREAQIELGLERVRARTMAMNSSHELAETASVLFRQLHHLGIVTQTDRLNIGVIDEETSYTTIWITKLGGELQLQNYHLFLNEFPPFEQVYQHWKKLPLEQRKDFFGIIELEGEEITNYKIFIARNSNLIEDSVIRTFSPPKYYHHSAFFSHGLLTIMGLNKMDESGKDILKRFAAVFEQSHTRFLDLQRAEAQAKDAVRQASLDRVRAEIASMRTTGDLERITPLIWKELSILSVPFIRCGVFIMDEKEEQIHIYLSTPDGKAIASFQLPINSEGLIQHVLNNWRSNQIFVNHWDAATFAEWTQSLVGLGVLKQEENYGNEKPPENLYLHFLPFLQGMLYVGNVEQLSKDDRNLIQLLASAFSTAYSRYEDFNKLENAKQQIEKTLNELKSAQSQLIQKEKMASLGELTAGIAHEIQNPLNFINNFSEVNDELIDEMKEQLASGKRQEAVSIANDIKANEQKINQHGKRADAIVKGMLQHSRSSSGKKELADINALADEYLRLSYHGLRGKDKDFNADFTTDFDKKIGKINVVPQDIGRVLLNLINNAFYAVSARQKTEDKSYRPMVQVKTKKVDSRVEIIVSDNGTGIPANILDKIFQPFFTTKPTGQGTGLGLSLSYDIIKAHGGELKVETREGDGATFFIQLPGLA